jgi:class 3 adenylate cyclase
MRRWMLQFDEPEAERAFIASDDENGMRGVRFGRTIGVVFTVAYGGVDVLVVHHGLLAAALTRAVVVLMFVVAGMVLARWKPARDHLQIGSTVLLTGVMVALGPVIGRVSDLPTEYLQASATVTFLGGVGLLRMRMHAVLAVGAAYAAVCLSLPGAFSSVDGVGRIVAPAAGLTTIGVLMAYALERLRRTDFLAQREVELERARSEELLHNVLPETIAQRLKSETGAIADSAADVSVLFSDIVGFTPVSERLAPEELVQLLDTMFREFDELCDRRGIEKIKTVGDAYMAVAGLPVADDDHAASVAELALDMQRTLARLSPAWPSPIAMRIGIASGPVVAGVIGQRKFTYDLWGDTVNTASRMESHGRAHRIQVSEATHALLEDRYSFSAPQTVDVKGKGPMTTYFLLGRLVGV